MAGNTAKALKSVPTTKSQSKSSNLSNSIQTISGRQSKEIFVAFCGAIGAGISTLKQVAREELVELGYEIIDLRVSKLMEVFPEYVATKPENSFDRYKIFQDLGDQLRDKYNRQILAEAVINEVSIIKESSKQQILDKLKEDDSSANPDELEQKAQSIIDKKGAEQSGLEEGTPILYRAGDQPNNALSLNVFDPGEVAATGGTSGVFYAVTDNLSGKESTRVNNFAHVNYIQSKPRVGKLLNINGAGRPKPPSLGVPVMATTVSGWPPWNRAASSANLRRGFG